MNKEDKRVDKNNYYLDIAETVLERATCLRRIWGAIIVKNGQILSTGYNNPPRGEPHCWQCTKCGNGKDITTYLACPSVHAQMNALLSVARRDMIGADLYLAGFDVKYFAYTSLNAAKSAISAKKQVVFNTLS